MLCTLDLISKKQTSNLQSTPDILCFYLYVAIASSSACFLVHRHTYHNLFEKSPQLSLPLKSEGGLTFLIGASLHLLHHCKLSVYRTSRVGSC